MIARIVLIVIFCLWSIGLSVYIRENMHVVPLFMGLDRIELPLYFLTLLVFLLGLSVGLCVRLIYQVFK